MKRPLPIPIVALGGLVVLSVVVLFWLHGRGHHGAGPVKHAATAPLYEPGDKPATLYLRALDTETGKLVNQTAVIRASRLRANQVKQLLMAFLDGARSGKVQVPVPEGLALNEFYLTPSGQAVVDLSTEGVRKDHVGFFEEALLVRCLVDTLDGNFFEVHSVKILLDGQEVPSLFGHYALGTSEANMASTAAGTSPVD
ncbi:MAG TPA: GerMN domain-containing protein [bacterium]|nr:GerMN domain-containing protein [bacterium]